MKNSVCQFRPARQLDNVGHTPEPAGAHAGQTGNPQMGAQEQEPPCHPPTACGGSSDYHSRRSRRTRGGDQGSADLDCDPMVEFARTHLYRDTVCTLCEKTVALALDIPLDRFQARTRCSARIALGRQIAMYLCHTTFSLLLTEIGLHFRRDRTTVSYACALVEDKRDEASFDSLINQLESLLVEARDVIALKADDKAPVERDEAARCADESNRISNLRSRA